MKRTITLSISLIASLLFPMEIRAQDKADNELIIGKIGIGLHIEQFKLAELSQPIDISPSNRIILTITPSSSFRIEPEIGFSFLKNRIDNLSDISLDLGVGVFKLIPKGKTNLYYGLRMDYARVTNEFIDFSSGNPLKRKSNKIGLGPALGAEYFLGQHISVGGEVAIKYWSFKTKAYQFGGGDEKQSFIVTNSGLLLRFYF